MAKTEASVRESDIGDDYEVMVHPPGITLEDFFLQILERGAEQAAPLVIRLEDDVRVNRHILANVRAWPALDEEDFGMGWLFVPRGMAEDRTSQRRGPKTGTPYRSADMTHASQAILFTRAGLPDLIEACRSSEMRGRVPQDLLVTSAAGSVGRRIYLHLPTLAEHDLGEPSVFGHAEPHDAYNLSADGTFDPDWHCPDENYAVDSALRDLAFHTEVTSRSVVRIDALSERIAGMVAAELDTGNEAAAVLGRSLADLIALAEETRTAVRRLEGQADAPPVTAEVAYAIRALNPVAAGARVLAVGPTAGEVAPALAALGYRVTGLGAEEPDGGGGYAAVLCLSCDPLEVKRAQDLAAPEAPFVLTGSGPGLAGLLDGWDIVDRLVLDGLVLVTARPT